MAEPQLDLASVVEKVRQGDDEASRSLMEILYPTIIRIVRSHLPIRSSEEDLAQEIFVKIFSRLDRYEARPGIPITHWVSRIAVTHCLDALRAERRRPELRWADLSEEQVSWLEYLATDDSPAPQGTDQDAQQIMNRILQQLPAEDRIILNLLHLEERTVKSISQITGWSIPSVKVRAFRARRRLRSTIQKVYSVTRYEDL